MDYSSQLEQCIKFLRQCQKDYEWCSDMLRKKELEKCDLEHELELAARYEDRMKVMPKLYKVLKERRKAKDIIAATEPVVEFIKEQKRFLNKLDALLGEVRKIENGQQYRSYRARVRDDLTICNKG